mmetsp:Transcript_4775/g.8187  ORF Transcript_4775/g.8187 Transcript_4775/m.8187 type:complete len:260 (+) Transcript_4775:1494-2273(+)
MSKKSTTMAITYDNNLDLEDTTPKLLPIYVTPENQREVVYSDLLQRLMVFIQSLRSNTGLWREHVQLLRNLTEVIHLFYMPEVHKSLVPLLVDFLYKGNKDIKEVACDCLAKILKHQHHSPSREELIQVVLKELSYGSSWILRRTFIIFCRYAVRYLPRELFKKHFLKDFVLSGKDRVHHVRQEFAQAMFVIKPHFDYDTTTSLELMDSLQQLLDDPDANVVEAAEHTDFQLLNIRRKDKAKEEEEEEQQKVLFQQKLA